MQWVFEHIQIIIVVAAIIASWVTNLRKNQQQRGGGSAPDNPFDGDVESAPTEDAEDLTRRIQEEIRRKIAERRGEASSPAPAPFQPEPSSPLRDEPPPLRPVPALAETATPKPGEIERDARQRQLREELRRQAAERAAPPPLPFENETEEADAALARQRELAERLAALELAREQIRATAVAATGESVAAMGSASLRHELRDPRALRRAFVLREILGPPVALR
jgi:hypothetical protein